MLPFSYMGLLLLFQVTYYDSDVIQNQHHRLIPFVRLAV